MIQEHESLDIEPGTVVIRRLLRGMTPDQRFELLRLVYGSRDVVRIPQALVPITGRQIIRLAIQIVESELGRSDKGPEQALALLDRQRICARFAALKALPLGRGLISLTPSEGQDDQKNEDQRKDIRRNQQLGKTRC